MYRSRIEGAAFAPAGSRTEPKRQLTDEQWLLIKDLFPHVRPSVKGGRPRTAPRDCFEGILWVLRTGARWKDIPAGFPSPVTCWRRFRQWTEAGVWQKAWARLLRKLDRLGQLELEETIADGTFSAAKKGANVSAKRNAAKGPRLWSLSMDTADRWPARSTAPVLTKSH